MLYPGAFAFVWLAGTCLQALRTSISADLIMRDSHSPAECFLMRDSHSPAECFLMRDSHSPAECFLMRYSHSPAEYIQMRLSLFQDSHTLSKVHLNAFSMLQRPYSRRNAFSPQLNHDEWCLIPPLALNEVPCLNASFSPVERFSLQQMDLFSPRESSYYSPVELP